MGLSTTNSGNQRTGPNTRRVQPGFPPSAYGERRYCEDRREPVPESMYEGVKKPPGRPPKIPDHAPRPWVNVRLKGELHFQLSRLSLRTGRNFQEVLGDALDVFSATIEE